MNNLNDLKTTDEFILHYYDELKRELKSQDLNISKVGVIGSFLHILGNLQFDIKNYYDGLFKEAFPITSTHEENLELHAQTYNYIIKNATASTLTGNIILNLNRLPEMPIILDSIYSQVERKIELTGLQFHINELSFLILTDYSIYITYYKDNDAISRSYTYEYIDKFGIKQRSSFQLLQNPSKTLNKTDGISLIECYQIEKEELSYTVPLYPYGSYYNIEILLDSYIDSLSVSVKENNSSVFIPYDTSAQKSITGSADRCVFYSVITKNNFQYLNIELGSGIYGKYIPNCEVNIILNKTKGEAGNIPAQQTSGIISGDISVIDTLTYPDLYNSINEDKVEIIEYPINIVNLKELITFDIFNASGGTNRVQGNELRKDLISFIQSRNNLLNELDFQNILANTYKYFTFILKKTSFQDNLIKLYISCLDKELLPQKMVSYPVTESIIIDSQIESKPYFYHPTVEIFSLDFISPFLYIYDSFFNVYKGYIAFPTLNFLPSNLEYSAKNIPPKSTPIICPDFKLEVIVGVTDGEANPDAIINKTVFILNFSTDTIEQNIIDSFTYRISIGNILFDSLMVDHKYIYPDLLIGSYDILVEVKKSELYSYIVKFNNIQVIYDYSDFLVLKNYQNLILDVPFIIKSEFDLDPIFYLSSLSSQLNQLHLKDNRLMSDELKISFLNSYFIPGEYLEKISAQNYNTSLFFPLHLRVNLIINRNYTLTLIELIDDLKLKIARFLSEKTGTQIKFYSSELVELIHLESWIKHASIKVYDNEDFLIEDTDGESNLEVYNIQDYLPAFSKELLINLSPPLFWWDINNIEINYKILGE